MNKYIVFRSLLIYLLLCYGKKFIDANERKPKNLLSHPRSSSGSSHSYGTGNRNVLNIPHSNNNFTNNNSSIPIIPSSTNQNNETGISRTSVSPDSSSAKYNFSSSAVGGLNNNFGSSSHVSGFQIPAPTKKVYNIGESESEDEGSNMFSSSLTTSSKPKLRSGAHSTGGMTIDLDDNHLSNSFSNQSTSHAGGITTSYDFSSGDEIDLNIDNLNSSQVPKTIPKSPTGSKTISLDFSSAGSDIDLDISSISNNKQSVSYVSQVNLVKDVTHSSPSTHKLLDSESEYPSVNSIPRDSFKIIQTKKGDSFPKTMPWEDTESGSEIELSPEEIKVQSSGFIKVDKSEQQSSSSKQSQHSRSRKVNIDQLDGGYIRDASSSYSLNSNSSLNIPDPVEIITSSGPSLTSVNDSSKFDFEEYDYGYLYKFNDTDRCIGVKYANSDVWKYVGDPINVYPKSICLRKDNPIILFEFADSYYLYGCVENKFKFISKEEFESAFNFIRVVTKTDSTPSVNNKNDYEFKHYGLLFEYRFKSNVRCLEVKYNESTAWKHSNNQQDPYPTVLYIDVISPIIVSLIINNTPQVYIYYNEFWEPIEEVLKKQIKPESQKKAFVLENSESEHEIKSEIKSELKNELKSDYIYETKPKFIFEQPPNEVSSIKSVRLETESEFEDIASVKTFSKPKIIKPQDIQSEFRTSPTTKPLDDSSGSEIELDLPKPRPQQMSGPEYSSQLPKDTHRSIPKSNEVIYFSETEAEKDSDDEDVMKAFKQAQNKYVDQQVKSQFRSESISTPNSISKPPKSSNLIVLDIQETRSTNVVDYVYDPITETHIYIPKDVYLIKNVSIGEINIWEPKDEKYAFGVIFREILNEKPYLKVFVPEGEELDRSEKIDIMQKEIDRLTALSQTSKVTDTMTPIGKSEEAVHEPHEESLEPDLDENESKMPIMIDIKKKESTEQFEFAKKNCDCGIYTPKHNFIFKVVKYSAFSILGTDLDIWCPDNDYDYVNKIMIDGIGKFSNPNNAILFLVNGNIKHFTMLNEKWIEVDPSVLLDISKTDSNYEYDCYRDDKNNLITFVPRGHFLFKGVKKSHGIKPKRSSVDIWSAKNKCDYASKAILKSSYNSEKYLLLFLVNGFYKLYYRSNKGKVWRDESTNLSSFNNLKIFGIDIDPRVINKSVADKFMNMRLKDSKKIPVLLNIEIKSDTNEFNYSLNGTITSYVPKHNIVFKGVIHKTEAFDIDIWKSEDDHQHAYRIILGRDPWNPFKKRVMVIIMLNANFMFYEETGDFITWKNITSTRYSLLNLKMYTFERDAPNSYKQIQPGEYKINSISLIYGYSFNPGVDCAEIRYHNVPLWRYNDNPRNGYPKGIYLNIANNGFYIKFYDRWMLLNMDEARYQDSNVKHIEKKSEPDTPSSYGLSCPLMQSYIKFTTLVGDRSFVQDERHYTIMDGYLLSTFEFSENLIKVQYGDNMIWSHKLRRYGNQFPKKLYFDHLGYIIVAFTDNWYYVFEYNSDRWKLICKNENEKPDDLVGMSFPSNEVKSFASSNLPKPIPPKHSYPSEFDQPDLLEDSFPPPNQIHKKRNNEIIVLDLDYLNNPDAYIVNHYPEKIIVKARQMVLFSMVKRGDVIMWKPKNDSLPNKVIFKQVNGQEKLKVYFPPDEGPVLSRLKSGVH